MNRTVRYDSGAGYDYVGNRQSRTVEEDAGLISAGVTAATQAYDNRDLVGPTTYTYDSENRLIQVVKADSSEVTLVYDADGNRVGKTTSAGTTQYLVESRNPTGYAQVMEERDGSGDTTATYVYGLELVSQTRGGTTHYYGYDGLGSVRYLTEADGDLADTYTYDAFGIQIASTGSAANAYRYTGEQWDADLGMYYLRARYYQPTLGRFWNADTYGGNQCDPLSLNKYLYCHANPVNGVDLSGNEFSLSGTITAIGIQGVLRVIYDTVITSAGNAMQKTIMGVQAGKQMEAILGEYIDETINGAIVGYALGKVLGKALDLDGLDSAPITPVEEARFVPFKPRIGTKVYRVIRPNGNPYGRSWTTINPRKVKNFADSAGLPIEHEIYQGKALVVEGEIINAEKIFVGPAENSLAIPTQYGGGPGNAGGLLELRIDDAVTSVRLTKPPEPFPVTSMKP